MKVTQNRVVKTILQRRQTCESLHKKFGSQEMYRLLERAISSGQIKAVEVYKDGFRFVFCRPDYPESKLKTKKPDPGVSARDFKLHCAGFGLKLSDFRKEFPYGKRSTMRIVGLNPKAFKFPVICEDTRTGHKYTFPVDSIKTRLQKEVVK